MRVAYLVRVFGFVSPLSENPTLALPGKRLSVCGAARAGFAVVLIAADHVQPGLDMQYVGPPGHTTNTIRPP